MPKFSVKRSTTISAPIEDVYSKVVDYSNWSTWSPWLCAEPDTKVTISDSPNQVGSTYRWNGEITGSGVLEHKSLTPPNRIVDEIQFLSGFKSTSEVVFEFKEVASGTQVDWYMNGSLPWFMFFMTGMLDTYIGRDYERGLKMLKEWIETGQILSQTEVKGVQPVSGRRMAGLRQTCSLDEIGPSMQSVYPKVCQAFEKQGLQPTQGIAVYHRFDMKKKICDYTAGFVVDENTPLGSELVTCQIPDCSAIQVQHLGSYDHLGNAWSAGMMYQRYAKKKMAKTPPFELYVNSPDQVEAGQLETQIFIPVRT